MHPTRRHTGLFLLFLAALIIPASCGEQTGDESSSDQPLSDVLPSGWDGNGDWQGGVFAVEPLP